MAPRKSTLTVGRIRAFRWLLLVVALGLIGGLWGLYYLGRAARPTPSVDGGPSVTDEEVQSIGRGFDHTVSHEGKPMLRIRGNRDRRDNQGNLHVEEVLITAYQRDGSRYEVAADEATYSLETREAVLEGKVSLAGPEGFTLRTTALTLREGGRWLESRTPVTFVYGTETPLHGRAKALQAFIESGRFMLIGDVTMEAKPAEGEPPFSLTAERVIFDRNLHVVRAEGQTQLKWGRSQLRALRLAAHLDHIDNRLQFVRARWKVRAVFHDEDAQGRDRHMVAEGSTIGLLMDELGRAPASVELERGPGERRAYIRRGVPAADEAFEVEATRIDAQLVDGRISQTNAGGDVILISQAPGTPRRRLTARDATAFFTPEGQVARLEVTGGVEVREGPRKLTGDRASMTPERTEASGSPVILVSERGELRAPAITYTAETSLAHATGGVEATMAPGDRNPMRRTPLADKDDPIRVQSDEAFWRDKPQSFLFKGKVRAWSGDRVLRAEQLRGEPDQQLLTAAGAVETVWFMPAPEGEGGAPQQVRVTAETMSYSDREDLLVYEEKVRVVEADRTLLANRLQVELDEQGEAERMTATGDVTLNAQAEGRTITAQSADYDFAGERVVFQGSPVTLKDAKGGTLSGAQAVYSTADGKVRVTAAEEPLAAASPGGSS
jgi:lipopolysaccharide transport protein LptA/LPS export ABC transporter protein LptC